MEFKKEINFPMSEETFMNIFRDYYTQIGDSEITYREMARTFLNYDEAGKLIGTSEYIPLNGYDDVLLLYDAETQTATFISYDAGLLSVDQTPSCIVLTVCNNDIKNIRYDGAYTLRLIDKDTGRVKMFEDPRGDFMDEDDDEDDEI